MRPTFLIDLPLSPEEVMARLEAGIAHPDCPCHGISVEHHAEIFIDPPERHFWSPWLSLSVEETEQGCRLRGRFAPAPSIWTFVIFLYFLFGFAMFAGVMYGYSQWVLGLRPWGLLAFPLCAMAIASIFVAGLLGQRLGREQMAMLRELVDQALEASWLEAEEITTGR